MKIKSKVNTDTTWVLTVKGQMTPEDVKFIENFDPTIYHNDLTAQLWAFDTKLPSGLWLQNITFNNELTRAAALVE